MNLQYFKLYTTNSTIFYNINLCIEEQKKKNNKKSLHFVEVVIVYLFHVYISRKFFDRYYLFFIYLFSLACFIRYRSRTAQRRINRNTSN